MKSVTLKLANPDITDRLLDFSMSFNHNNLTKKWFSRGLVANTVHLSGIERWPLMLNHLCSFILIYSDLSKPQA